MKATRRAALAAVLALAFCAALDVRAAGAGTKTVCTITVNSDDEKEAFRRRLPRGEYRFVELVERGRRDWLAASCEKAIACDLLVISGHFNAGDSFYSDKVGGADYLRVEELERASCSGSCPALFSRLKEVYLFGCESLNPDASRYASSSGDSGRGRMQRIFADVPVIYGFSAGAPVGPMAAMLLDRFFDGGASEVGSGRASARLLRTFAGNGLVATRGVGDADLDRRRNCMFLDARLAPARKLASIHALMQRDMRAAGASFERIDRLLASLSEAELQAPDFLQVLAAISADDATRERYLAALRATRPPPLRARMIALAGTFGWLSPGAQRAELARMVDEMLASPGLGFADVGVVCALPDASALGVLLATVLSPAAGPIRTAMAAVQACAGDPAARARALAGLSSVDEREVQVAQSYLRERPASDAVELRALAHAIASMPAGGAQARALDALGRMHIVDEEILERLTRLSAATPSAAVRRAVTEVFLRAGPNPRAPPVAYRWNVLPSVPGETG